MTTSFRTVLKRGHLAAVALAVVVVPVAAGPADAATKHRSHKAKHSTVTHKRTAAKPKRAVAKPKRVVAKPAPAVAPAPVAAPVAAPAVNSVISIGGYVFYNLSYAEAVDAYTAAVAAAPAGYTPPPVTSVSVTTTVGSG